MAVIATFFLPPNRYHRFQINRFLYDYPKHTDQIQPVSHNINIQQCQFWTDVRYRTPDSATFDQRRTVVMVAAVFTTANRKRTVNGCVFAPAHSTSTSHPWDFWFFPLTKRQPENINYSEKWLRVRKLLTKSLLR